MAFIGNNGKANTQTFTPLAADPANPVEGMVFRSDGTPRAAGLWQYLSSAWVELAAATATLSQHIRYTGNAGQSSTNTKILYWNNVGFNTGSAILTVSNSGTTGFSVTATQDCVVTLTFTSASTGAGNQIAIGKDITGSMLTTDPAGWTNTEKRNNLMAYDETKSAGLTDVITVSTILANTETLMCVASGTITLSNEYTGVTITAVTV